MSNKEGAQIDTLPIQLYGWDYVNGIPVKIVVNSDGEIEVSSG